MTTIPNEIIIKVNTKIPGRQNFTLEPSMVIQNISKDDKRIYINPLKKLDAGDLSFISEKK
jgi:hypothetical protein